MTTSTLPPVLRVPDLATLLGVSVRAAQKMIERGQIPSRRIGRRVVVLGDELLDRLRAS